MPLFPLLKAWLKVTLSSVLHSIWPHLAPDFPSYSKTQRLSLSWGYSRGQEAEKHANTKQEPPGWLRTESIAQQEKKITSGPYQKHNEHTSRVNIFHPTVRLGASHLSYHHQTQGPSCSAAISTCGCCVVPLAIQNRISNQEEKGN